MIENGLLITILCIAFSAAYPTHATTSSYGAVADIRHLSGRMSNVEATVNPALENFDGGIHATGITEHTKNCSDNCEQGKSDDIQDQQWIMEKTLCLPDILRIIFNFLKSKELRIAAQVCKVWNREADDVERLRSVFDIFTLGSPCSGKSCAQEKLLKRFSECVHNGSEEERLMWHPELTMIFGTRRHEHFEAQVSSREVAEKSLDKVMQVVLQCSRIFATGTNLQPAIDVDAKYAKSVLNELSCAFVFPESLLERPDVHVKVIIPIPDLSRISLTVSTNEPEQNKQLFEELFGWKKEYPIKSAIVISRRERGDVFEDIAKRQSKEICRFLKSLPEAGNMPICVISNYFTNEEDPEMRLRKKQVDGSSVSSMLDSQYRFIKDRKFGFLVRGFSRDGEATDYYIRSNGPVAVILFGGEAVQSTAFFWYRIGRGFGNPLESALEHWKAGECKCLSNSTQTIAFSMHFFDRSPPPAFFSNALGDDKPCVFLDAQDKVVGIGKAETNVDEIFDENRFMGFLGFLLIGFE